MEPQLSQQIGVISVFEDLSRLFSLLLNTFADEAFADSLYRRFPKGAMVTVAAFDWLPHIMVTTNAEGHRVVTGPMGKMLTILAHTLNFTYSVVLPADSAWGAEEPNGTWTGMMGQVTRKEADVALGPFGITYNRALAVDFTESFFFDALSILSRKGVPEINPWGFLYPLTGSVWAAVAAALAVVWLATMLVGRKAGRSVSLSWAGEVFLQNVRVFLNQGLTDVVLGHGGVMVLVSWVVVASVVFWSYTGALISLLAVRHIPQPIQTLRDLLDDHTITLILYPMTVLTDTISKMKSGELRELHEMKFVGRIRYARRYEVFHGLFETVVRHGSYSMLEITLALDLMLAGDFFKTKKCDFYKTRQTFFTTSHCMIGQKGSPLVPAFNPRIRAVVESGLYVHWLMKEFPAVTTCRFSPSIILVREPLSFANLWGMFVVLGAGLLLAAFVFCMELYVPPPKEDKQIMKTMNQRLASSSKCGPPAPSLSRSLIF